MDDIVRELIESTVPNDSSIMNACLAASILKLFIMVVFIEIRKPQWLSIII